MQNKIEYFFYQGMYYALMKIKGDNFKDGDAIFEVFIHEFEPSKVTRFNFVDAETEFKKGRSEYCTVIPFVAKWNEVEFCGQKIAASEFYAAAKKVLKY